ncbi:hypothetical protein Pmani_014737 [Petrolisthes manimaculis]|uniref:Uncharacterized protein n=1 Tax=Petrolisthes manimaculis TaxID=1843537 RepID=A0AAE1UCS4_9EUCA|nr:hypothetical protein Pmani_014737 [Petrolisthes manimaculis]
MEIRAPSSGNVGLSSGVGSLSSAPPIRGQRKRGRPKGSTLRGRLSRAAEAVGTGSAVAAATTVSAASSSPSGLSSATGSPGGSGSPSGSGAPVKRGRGRPRLLPLGPGHQGTRTPPALPLALGTALNTPKTEENSQKPFGFYT